MKQATKWLRLSIISIIIIIPTISCNLISTLSTKAQEKTSASAIPAFPTETVPAIANGNQIVFSEADVTGWINDFSAQNPDFELQDPQVLITNGICTISGNLVPKDSSNTTSLYNSLSGKLELQFGLTLDSSQNPVVEIKSLILNNESLPQFIVAEISKLINNSLSSSLSSELKGQKIEQVIMQDGKIIITLQ